MPKSAQVGWKFGATLTSLGCLMSAGICLGQATTVTADPAIQTRRGRAPSSSTDNTNVTSVPEDFAKVRLSPGVLLKFGVYDAPEMDATLRVAGDGTVLVPLAGSLPVGGLSVPEARAKIRTALVAGDYFKEPQVSLDILQLASGYVTVTGEVQTPGRFQIISAMPLRSALALAGGETVEAGTDLEIQRSTGGAIEHVMTDKGTGVLDLVTIAPGDSVTVPREGIVYVLGAVKKPGGYLMVNRGSLNVLEAVALAGGTSLEASPDTVRVLHRHADQVVEETVKLADFSSGRVPSPALGDKDIVYVPSSKLKSVFINGSNIIAAAAASLVYRVP